MRSIILPLVLLMSLLAGCASQPGKPVPAVSSADYDVASFAGFGEALEASMNAQDTSLFVEHLDSHRFAQRSLKSLGLTAVREKVVDNYARIMGKALKSRFKETFADVESARFIRLLPDEVDGADAAVALIRISPQDGGINYWKVYMERVDGQVHVVDWFSYTLGDLASRSLGTFVLQVGAAMLKPESANALAVKAYLAAAKSGDPQKLIDSYSELPAKFRNNSLLMFSYLQASKRISEESYTAALQRLSPVYARNDDYAMLLMDYYLYTGQYPQAHKEIDKVAGRIGDDAGLDSLHAGIALADKHYDKSIAYAREGIRREADYEGNYWILLDALVFSKNYDDAVLVLNILEEGFHYQFDMDQLAKLDGYAVFAQSEAFQGWRTASNY
jgi:hypothetical protein